MVAAIATSQAAEVDSKESVKQLWLGTLADDEAVKGALDAYHGTRPQSTDPGYLSGYMRQLQALPTDENGVIEWFRFRIVGGWKLTNNI